MGCTALLHDRRALGQCYQGEWNNLPSYYQYFNEPTLAGGLASVDYCPYVRPFSNRVCVHPRDQPSPNYQGMIMSDDSYCFESTLRQAIDGKTVTSPKVACYKVECVSPSLLRINISKHNGGTQVVECTGTETKSVSGFTGSFTCIDPGVYCTPAFRTTDVKSSGLGWISPTTLYVESSSQATGTSLGARMEVCCAIMTCGCNCGAATLSVVRFGGSLGAANATLTLRDGTAVAGVDYEDSPLVVFWSDGEEGMQEFAINITTDTRDGRSFYVDLVSGMNISIVSPTTAEVILGARPSNASLGRTPHFVLLSVVFIVLSVLMRAHV